MLSIICFMDHLTRNLFFLLSEIQFATLPFSEFGSCVLFEYIGWVVNCIFCIIAMLLLLKFQCANLLFSEFDTFVRVESIR